MPKIQQTTNYLKNENFKMTTSTHTLTNDEQQLLNMASRQMKTFNAGDVIKAKNLFKQNFWMTQSRGVCSQLGGEIKRFVELNLLPLEFIGTDGSNHCQYRVCTP